MGDSMTEPTPNPDTAPPADTAAQPADGDTATKPDIDWKAKAREWEGKAKANKTAAEELATLKQSQMSEQERLTTQLAEAQQSVQTARAEALRYRIATKFQITDEDAETFLTGADEATLTRQAERLAALATARAGAPAGPPSFDGGTRPAASAGRSMNDVIRQAAGRA